jgi:hypothetical protein
MTELAIGTEDFEVLEDGTDPVIWDDDNNTCRVPINAENAARLRQAPDDIAGKLGGSESRQAPRGPRDRG